MLLHCITYTTLIVTAQLLLIYFLILIAARTNLPLCRRSPHQFYVLLNSHLTIPHYCYHQQFYLLEHSHCLEVLIQHFLTFYLSDLWSPCLFLQFINSSWDQLYSWMWAICNKNTAFSQILNIKIWTSILNLQTRSCLLIGAATCYFYLRNHLGIQNQT